MNRRVVLILACAAVFATCLSYLAYQTLGRRNTAPPVQMTGVVVAAHDLELGTIISTKDVRLVKWAGPVPAGIARSTESILSRGVVSKIYEGEAIMANRLASPGAGGGLAATIPAGMRACAVKVNEVVGVAGFVIAGMRVDVLITGVPPGAPAESGPRVTTLLQNIAVLSAGTNIQKDNEGKPQQVQVVNLLVNPEQAERLSLAGNEAHIQLILRNPLDTEIAQTPGSAMSHLFGRTSEPAPVRTVRAHPVVAAPVPQPLFVPEPPRPPVQMARTVEVLNGSAHSEARFTRNEEQQP